MFDIALVLTLAGLLSTILLLRIYPLAMAFGTSAVGLVITDPASKLIVINQHLVMSVLLWLGFAVLVVYVLDKMLAIATSQINGWYKPPLKTAFTFLFQRLKP